MPRILVADDHPKVRRLVCDVLESEEGWEICGEAATGREAIALTAANNPDIVVLDLCMPELNGLEAAREIHARFPQTAILILTMHDARELIEEALASGARACLTKSNLQHLVEAVQGVLRQGGYSNDSTADRFDELKTCLEESSEQIAETEELNDCELEIVRMLAQAKTSKEIALRLSITVKAVEAKRAVIMRKLEINSMFDLMHYAVRSKLVEIKGPFR
jgi:DNA-binding NarL/FixJ family response regulator